MKLNILGIAYTVLSLTASSFKLKSNLSIQKISKLIKSAALTSALSLSLNNLFPSFVNSANAMPSNNEMLRSVRIPSSSDNFDRLFDDYLSEFQRSNNRDFPFRNLDRYLKLDQFQNDIPIDIKEEKDGYIIYCDVPGVKKEDVKIEINEHLMTITTEKKNEIKEDSDKILRMERFEGTISRSITLPDDAIEDNISAHFENGVLKINVKKNKSFVNKTKQVVIT
jgi:HSP20 family protein